MDGPAEQDSAPHSMGIVDKKEAWREGGGDGVKSWRRVMSWGVPCPGL